MKKTTVAFLDYDNGWRYLNPTITLVEFEGSVSWDRLRKSEWKQPGRLRRGGSELEILEDLDLPHKILIKNYDTKNYEELQNKIESLKPDIVYKLTVGNY